MSASDPDGLVTPWLQGSALLEQIRLTRPAPGTLALWHLGQSGFAVRAGDLTLYFDPFLSPSTPRLRRTWEPPFRPEEAADVDLVFCSHDHLDHLDPGTVTGIAAAAPEARFVVPSGARPRMEHLGISRDRVHVAEVDAARSYGPVSVYTVPAAHGDAVDPVAECVWEPDAERGYRYVGFVVECNGVRLYHAGDTVVYPGLVERLAGGRRIDLALLPINGRDWFRERQGIIGNTDHREAADLGHAIRADVIVPMHYDMFSANLGHPGWFAEYCAETYPGQGFHIPARCKRWLYVK